MPAKSKQQQKFFGVVKAMQKGDIPKQGEAGKVAKDMSKKDVDKYAGTKHKGLPKKVKQETMKLSDIKKIIEQEIKSLSEASMTRVTRQMWDKMDQEERINVLLTAFKDPDDAELHWEKDWNELPPEASHMFIYEELQSLNEVQPFVDNKLRDKYNYPLGNKDGLVYLATNDKRYPTEIVIYNQKRDVLHFVYSHNGKFTAGNTKTQTVPMQGFNRTHYVMPYFEEWEEDWDYERGFKEVTELRRVKRLDIKIGNKINIARAKSHFKKGEKIAAIDKRTGEIIPITGLNQFAGLPSRRYDYGYIVEAKMTPAKVQKIQRELVATIDLLKKNFPMYKAAKDSGDEKKSTKHRDIAIKLTKKKKQLEKQLDAALGGLYQDAELELNEATLPKFKTPVEAYKWIMGKRGEAMDIETEMMETSKEIQMAYGEMEQEAEPGGGPTADRYGKEIEALEDKHKELRAQFDMVMAEIDEYDQNY